MGHGKAEPHSLTRRLSRERSRALTQADPSLRRGRGWKPKQSKLPRGDLHGTPRLVLHAVDAQNVREDNFAHTIAKGRKAAVEPHSPSLIPANGPRASYADRCARSRRFPSHRRLRGMSLAEHSAHARGSQHFALSPPGYRQAPPQPTRPSMPPQEWGRGSSPSISARFGREGGEHSLLVPHVNVLPAPTSTCPRHSCTHTPISNSIKVAVRAGIR